MNQARKVLYEIVKKYSPSGQEKKVADFMRKFMLHNGFNKAYIDKTGNVIGEIGQGFKTILLLGHIDTVPGRLPVKISANKMFGRGSVDAKGSMAAFMMAALNFKKSKKIKIVIVGTVGEELDGYGARGFIRDYPKSIDYVVIGEPNHWERINVGYKGSIYVEYKLKKPVVHTAFPSPTVIEEALVFTNHLRRLTKTFNQKKERAFDKLHFSIRKINTTHDGLTETIHLTINFRTPIGFNFVDLKKFIKNKKGKAYVEYHGEERAFRSSKNNYLVSAFLKAIRQEKGNPCFVVKTGTSDMNVIGEHYEDIPIVAYGPGDSSLDHTPFECLDLNEYEKSITVIIAMLTNLAGK